MQSPYSYPLRAKGDLNERVPGRQMHNLPAVVTSFYEAELYRGDMKKQITGHQPTASRTRHITFDVFVTPLPMEAGRSSPHNELLGSSKQRVKKTKARRLRACKRCHERRVKCNASLVGPPCSNCQQLQSTDCSFAESRRIRGSHGRFVPMVISEIPSNQVSTSTSQSPLTAPGEPPAKTVQEVDFTLDMTRLYKSEDSVGPVVIQITKDGQQGSTSPDQRRQPQHTFKNNLQSGTAFLGESWYASYLLRATGNENKSLQQSLSQGLHSSQGDERYLDSQYPVDVSEGSWEGIIPKQSFFDLSRQDLARLLEAYFTRLHVMFPILDKNDFRLSLYKGHLPIPLLQCVVFAAVMHCDADIYHRMGYDTRADARDDLFDKAKKSFDTHPEESRLVQLQCCFLLHFWVGQPTCVRDSSWWIGTAIRFAQSMGMHRSANESSMPRTRKAHWKRIWWCLYIRDRQVSLCMGTPMVINDLDLDVEDLTRDDFPYESDHTADYVIAQASLCRLTSSIYFCYLSPSRLLLSKDREYRRAAAAEILAFFDGWYKSLPDSLQYERRDAYLPITLRIIYNYWKIDFIQRLQRKAVSLEFEDYAEALDFASNITRDVENALLLWKPEYFPLLCVTAVFSAMTIQYVGSHLSNTHNRQLLTQKLRSNLLSLRQLEECYVLARWIRDLFHSSEESRARRPDSPLRYTPPNNEQNEPYRSAGIAPSQIRKEIETIDLECGSSIPSSEALFCRVQRQEKDQLVAIPWSTVNCMPSQPLQFLSGFNFPGS